MSDQVILSEEDVVSMAEDDNFAGASTSTGEELMETVRNLVFQNTSLQEDKALGWVEKGLRCKILLAQGGGWQKGKIRICFEFTPDNPTSSLDDLRSQLDTQ